MAAIYFKLLPMNEFQREEALLKIDELINSNLLYEGSDLYFVHQEIAKISLINYDREGEACLAKIIFVKKEFQSSKLLSYATSLLQDFNATVFFYPNLKYYKF
jgi:hypothetical protein